MHNVSNRGEEQGAPTVPFQSEARAGHGGAHLPKTRTKGNLGAQRQQSRRRGISSGKNIPQTARTLKDILNDRYMHQRDLLNEVVYNILRTASDKPLKQRINFKQLDAYLKVELRNNGISIPYHFTVTDRMGTLIYHCSDYVPDGNETLYSHVLFKNDPPQRMEFFCGKKLWKCYI